MELSLDEPRIYKISVDVEDYMFLCNKQVAVLVVIVAEKSRDLRQSLGGNDELSVLVLLDALGPQRQPVTVDSHQVEASPFDLKELALEHRVHIGYGHREDGLIYHGL